MSHESPATLETDECVHLLDTLLSNASTAKKKRKAVRNHCMALLMLDAGLRVGELVSLRFSDLFFNSLPVRTIIIKWHMTKNKLEHSIPVSQPLDESLRAFFSEWFLCDVNSPGEFAFPRSGSDKAITTRQVERIIRAAGWKALGRPVHPHVLRHTCASRWMRVTNEAVVQKLLGHRYLTSTQIYCHPNSDDLRQAVDSVTAQPHQEPSCEPQQDQQTVSQAKQPRPPVPASQIGVLPGSHGW